MTENEAVLMERLRIQLRHAMSALSHIQKTALASSTGTKRLRWIAERCRFGLNAIPYNDKDVQLPFMPVANKDEQRMNRIRVLRRALGDAILELECAQSLEQPDRIEAERRQQFIDALKEVHTVPDTPPKEATDAVETEAHRSV